MSRHTRHKRGGVWLVAGIATLVTPSAGWTRDAADGAAPEAVRNAVGEHVREAGGEMVFDDPTGDARLNLAFDHVHDGVKATEGGRQVVSVDFKSADGTAYDVDFYVDRSSLEETHAPREVPCGFPIQGGRARARFALPEVTLDRTAA